WAHIHAAHIEAADVGLERDDVADAFGRWFDGRARPGFLRVVLVRHEARPRPGGEVDEDVAAACPDPVHDLFVEGRIHAGPRGLGIAYVDVNDGGARLGRIKGGLRDLRGRPGHGGVAAGRICRAGHRARDHDFALHTRLPRHRRMVVPKPNARMGPEPRGFTGAEASKTATSILRR